MFSARTIYILLVGPILLLPSCATDRQAQTVSTAVPPTSPSPDTPTAASPAQVSIVTPASYSQGSETNAEIITLLPPETLAVNNPIGKTLQDHGALSLADLEQMALANNPSVAEAWARVEAAHGKWVQAGLPPNPRLGFSGQQLGSSGLAEQQGVYIEQEVIRGGKLNLSRSVVSSEISVAEQLYETQRRRVVTDVRIAYYEVLCAQKRIEIVQQLVDIGNHATRAASELLEKKEGSRRDMLQARIDSQSAQNLLQQAKNQHTSAWRILAAELGTPEMPQAPLLGQLDETGAKLAWENSLQRLQSESPEIASALMRIERARWAVDRAWVEAVPDVNVQGIIQHDNSTGSSNGSLLVSLPIPLWNRNQGGICQAESELVAAQRASERVELSMQRRLAPVFERYRTSRNRVENYRSGILRDAQESLNLTRGGYEAGELSFLNLLTAQRTYFRANLDYVEALRDMWTAHSEIEGLLLANSLENGSESWKMD